MRQTGGRAALYAVGEKYVTAVSEAAEGLPWLIPPLGDAYDMPDLVRRLDGLFVTGGRSNIEPHRYGRTPSGPRAPATRHATPPPCR